MNLILLRLGRVHGEGVHEGAGDGDGRADDGSRGHGGLEGDDGGHDDDDALDGVADGVGDGVDLRCVCVCEMIDGGEMLVRYSGIICFEQKKIQHM